jgi:hypothetical protein
MSIATLPELDINYYKRMLDVLLTRGAYPLSYTMEKIPDRPRPFSRRLPSLTPYLHTTTTRAWKLKR